MDIKCNISYNKQVGLGKKKSRISRRSQASMGTIIIFIALILIAIVAAGVLIQTTQSLQSKALLVGSKARENIADFLIVSNIYGADGTGSSLDKFYVRMKIIPSSSGTAFSDLSIEMLGTSQSQTLEYNQTVTTCDPAIVGTGFYNVEYVLNNSAQSREGYLMPGDVAEICFSSYAVGEGSTEKFKITSSTGKTMSVDFVAPATFTQQIVPLYP